MLSEFVLPILYTQVLLHDTTHPSPGLNWDDAHVAQGFAWSPGLVSFGVPDHDGDCMIQVRVEDELLLLDEAIWAVMVPYTVTEPIEVGTVGLLTPVEVPHGSYNLVLEALPGLPDQDIAYILVLTFVRTQNPEFAILRQGGELTTDSVLMQDASLSIPVE